MELETLGRMLRLKRHFRNEEKPGKVKSQSSLIPQSSFNPDNKDSNIELYMNSLEKKLMKIEIPKDRCNGLTSEERKALYDLKMIKILLLKMLVVSAVVVWDREDYIKEAEKQLGISNVYEEVPDDPEPPISTIHTTLEKLRKGRDLKKENIQKYWYLEPPVYVVIFQIQRGSI